MAATAEVTSGGSCEEADEPSPSISVAVAVVDEEVAVGEPAGWMDVVSPSSVFVDGTASTVRR